MSNIEEAFLQCIKDHKKPQGAILSLYQVCPFYGGPEEGGWWGEDVVLVAYKTFPTREQAAAAKAEVEQLAERLNREERTNYGDLCLRQLEHAESLGCDANDLYGEVDGPSQFFVVIESFPGEHNHRDNRHYG